MGRQAPRVELLPRQRTILEQLSWQRTVERRLAEREVGLGHEGDVVRDARLGSIHVDSSLSSEAM